MAFSVYFSQEPIHNGKTISERSTDPNGSLILGLKTTKKPLTQVSLSLFPTLNLISDAICPGYGIHGIILYISNISRQTSGNIQRFTVSKINLESNFGGMRSSHNLRQQIDRFRYDIT